MVERAQTTNARLRGDFPVGFALDARPEHHQFIGRRPIICCGNSDGDHAMLQYTTINNPRPSFGLIVHHIDDEREYAYDANTKSTGKLVEALREAPMRGWVVVDMKQDWKVIFRPESSIKTAPHSSSAGPECRGSG